MSHILKRRKQQQRKKKHFNLKSLCLIFSWKEGHWLHASAPTCLAFLLAHRISFNVIIVFYVLYSKSQVSHRYWLNSLSFCLVPSTSMKRRVPNSDKLDHLLHCWLSTGILHTQKIPLWRSLNYLHNLAQYLHSLITKELHTLIRAGKTRTLTSRILKPFSQLCSWAVLKSRQKNKNICFCSVLNT